MEGNKPPEKTINDSSNITYSKPNVNYTAEKIESEAGEIINQCNLEKKKKTSENEAPKQRNQKETPLPHELTAEWTVRAQLRFARAGEIVNKKFNTSDPVSPVKVVYKWTTLGDDVKSFTETNNSEYNNIFHSVKKF